MAMMLLGDRKIGLPLMVNSLGLRMKAERRAEAVRGIMASEGNGDPTATPCANRRMNANGKCTIDNWRRALAMVAGPLAAGGGGMVGEIRWMLVIGL